MNVNLVVAVRVITIIEVTDDAPEGTVETAAARAGEEEPGTDA